MDIKAQIREEAEKRYPNLGGTYNWQQYQEAFTLGAEWMLSQSSEQVKDYLLSGVRPDEKKQEEKSEVDELWDEVQKELADIEWQEGMENYEIANTKKANLKSKFNISRKQ